MSRWSRGLRVAERRSWEFEGTNEESTSDAMRTRCCSRRLSRQQVVCPAAGVFAERMGTRDTKRPVAKLLGRGLAMRCAGRVARRVRHRRADGAVLLLRRLQQWIMYEGPIRLPAGRFVILSSAGQRHCLQEASTKRRLAELRLQQGPGSSVLRCYIRAAAVDSMNKNNATRHAAMVHLRSGGVSG